MILALEGCPPSGQNRQEQRRQERHQDRHQGPPQEEVSDGETRNLVIEKHFFI